MIPREHRDVFPPVREGAVIQKANLPLKHNLRGKNVRFHQPRYSLCHVSEGQKAILKI